MKERTTTASVLTDDQGGGGMLCDTCGYFESRGHWKIDCPNCNRLITNHPIPEPYPYGGRDFE